MHLNAETKILAEALLFILSRLESLDSDEWIDTEFLKVQSNLKDLLRD